MVFLEHGTNLMVRILSGRYKGQTLVVPKPSRIDRFSIRPTTGKVRESFFNQVQGHLEGVRFLDLFAGSGLMGLEALSRGAASVVAVEVNPRYLQTIRINYEKLKVPLEQYVLVRKEATSYLAGSPPVQDPFGMVFLDPPYHQVLETGLTDEGEVDRGRINIGQVVDHLQQGGWLAPSGVIGMELPKAYLEAGFDLEQAGFSVRRFGDTMLAVSF